MNIDEKTIIKYFDIIIKELDDVSFFSVNNILIDNKHLKIDTKEEREYLFELTNKIKTLGISRGYFQKNGENGWLELTVKGIELKDSKKGFLKFIKDSKTKSESTFDKIIFYFKNNRIIAVLLFVVFVIFIGSKAFNEFSKAKENIEKINGSSDKSSVESDYKNETIKDTVELLSPKIVDSLELPYLKNTPILDKGIFFSYSYNNLLIGGANIDSIKINARTYDGQKLKFRKYDEKLEFDITEQPYIELEYKETIYSFEIIGKHYSFDCIITKDIVPTLNLIEVN
ncbi:hypothetical protein [Olleya sp. YS]|uniref:hypothetical protein n=1 Tax=Olleya sp. YS TaxID=3028318 RepID=UPI002434672F|nr:hypothetical protein [Olleya sp. YS]WGD34701.1 hypothetical protein Ollyesu_13035 [Olleya sp. YS]